MPIGYWANWATGVIVRKDHKNTPRNGGPFVWIPDSTTGDAELCYDIVNMDKSTHYFDVSSKSIKNKNSIMLDEDMKAEADDTLNSKRWKAMLNLVADYANKSPSQAQSDLIDKYKAL